MKWLLRAATCHNLNWIVFVIRSTFHSCFKYTGESYHLNRTDPSECYLYALWFLFARPKFHFTWIIISNSITLHESCFINSIYEPRFLLVWIAFHHFGIQFSHFVGSPRDHRRHEAPMKEIYCSRCKIWKTNLKCIITLTYSSCRSLVE